MIMHRMTHVKDFELSTITTSCTYDQIKKKYPD